MKNHKTPGAAVAGAPTAPPGERTGSRQTVHDVPARRVRLVGHATSGTTAVASGLLSSLAWGAPGDLDPAFADIGRLSGLSEIWGPAWAIDPIDDDFILGGGEAQVYYDNFPELTQGFMRRVTGHGMLDATYASAFPSDIFVQDVALQDDGRAVGVGRSLLGGQAVLTAFRLTATGELDATFGDGGLVRGPAGANLFEGSSVELDGLGRVVIAGTRAGHLAVVRLLPSGALDTTFGNAGVFDGRAVDAASPRPHIVRMGGGYRVTLNGLLPASGADPVPECWIAALTDDGLLDTTFGNSGYAALGALVGGSASCAALTTQSGDSVVAAGSSGPAGFAIRLLQNGQPDAAFSAPAVAANMTEATALAAAPDGALLVAGIRGTDISGALVVRLQADGGLDTLFGKAGSTWVDLRASFAGIKPVVHDIRLLTGGAAVLTGDDSRISPGHPFVARLLGDSGAGSPGVAGVERMRLETTDDAGQVVINVRRMGGSAGTVSVAYATRDGQRTMDPDIDPMPARAGQDYVANSGRLTWADGDAEDKQVVVQILPSSDGRAELDEAFYVDLSAPQGEVGLGSMSTRVKIARHGGTPVSTVELAATSLSVRESQGAVTVDIYRGDSAQGPLAVTLMASPGTATAGADYRFESMTVEWADGDLSTRTVTIPIVNDSRRESSESFSVQLTNVTDGASIGPQSAATVTIDDDDTQSQKSGGGRIGFFTLLLLGLAGVARAVRRRPRAAARPGD